MILFRDRFTMCLHLPEPLALWRVDARYFGVPLLSIEQEVAKVYAAVSCLMSIQFTSPNRPTLATGFVVGRRAIDDEQHRC
jgi:hypothetical protein